MFHEEKEFDWKIVVASVAGIIVLLGGIYVGINSIEQKSSEDDLVIKTNLEKTKDAFYLNENCEIIINTVDDVTNEVISSKVMSTPEELYTKTEEEIVKYLEKNYPKAKLESITQGEILLQQQSEYKDPSKKNKYSVEIEDGIIGVYKYDINGNRKLERQTSRKIDSLPQKLQEEIQEGILADNVEEIDAILDSILS